MTVDAASASQSVVLAERRRLLNLAYRMLGTTADAEDAVQEAYARWFRLTDDERGGIRTPQAWLTRVTSNVCLDQLTSARHRRELYTGEWLPEPLPGTSIGGSATIDPLERAATSESVSMALLVLLETLGAAERVTFVLHDVFAMPFDEIAEIVGRTPQACRKLASTARRRVEQGRRRTASTENHDAVVREFWAACASGDVGSLLRLLDPNAVIRVDGGGRVSAALRPIVGAEKAVRYVLGGLAKQGGLALPDGPVARIEIVNGATGLVLRHSNQVLGVASFDVVDGAITEVWFVMTPDKLGAFSAT